MRSAGGSALDDSRTRGLLAKLEALPPEKLVEVEDFVDFLRARDQYRKACDAATRVSESAFAAVWDNPDDAAYDEL